MHHLPRLALAALAPFAPLFIVAVPAPTLAAAFAVRAEPTLQDFAGTFNGDSVKLALKVENKSLSGTLTIGAAALPVLANLDNTTLRGTFEVPTPDNKLQLFTFTATLSTDLKTLSLLSDGVTRTLTREQAKVTNPLLILPPTPAPKAETPAAPTTPAADSKPAPATPTTQPTQPTPPAAPATPAQPAAGPSATFLFPLGLRFDYPASWKREFKDDSLVFTTSTAGEIVSLDFDPAEGITNPLDPAVAEHLDGQALSLGEGIKRAGPPEKITAGGQPAAIYSYDAQTPQGAMKLQVYIVIRDTYAYALTHAGPAATVQASAPAIRKRFEQLTFLPRQLDPALQGTWRQTKHGGSSGGYAGGSSTTSEKTVNLNADGTFTSKTFSAGSTPMGGYTNEGETLTGTWAASGGLLIVIAPDGETFTFAYAASGGGLELKSPSGKVDTYFR